MTTLHDLIDLYVFPLGRRQFALREVAKRATEYDWPELSEECESVVTYDAKTRTLRQQARSARTRGADPRLAELDRQIDLTVGGLVRTLREAATTLEDRGAADLLQAAFPDGASAITQLPYEEALETLKALAPSLNERWAKVLQNVGATRYVTQLGTLLQEFEHALTTRPEGVVDTKTIASRLDEAQHRMLEVVAQIIGRFPRRTKTDTTARAALLAPLLHQQHRLSLDYRQRRGLSDIDPESGESIDEVVSPAPTDDITPPTR